MWDVHALTFAYRETVKKRLFIYFFIAQGRKFGAIFQTGVLVYQLCVLTTKYVLKNNQDDLFN